MDIFALIVAVLALVIAVVAYARVGGLPDVRNQFEVLGSKASPIREKTADAVGRVERFLRGKPRSSETTR